MEGAADGADPTARGRRPRSCSHPPDRRPSWGRWPRARTAAGRSFPLALFAELPVAAAHDALALASRRRARRSWPTSPALLAQAADLDGGEDLPAGPRRSRRGSRTTRNRTPGRTSRSARWQPRSTGRCRRRRIALHTLVDGVRPRRRGEREHRRTRSRSTRPPRDRRRPPSGWRSRAAGSAGAHAVPSLLWTTGPEARLLLTLGPPSPVALAFLANPRHRSSRLWPLRTAVASAMDHAWAALSPQQRAVLEDSGRGPRRSVRRIHLSPGRGRRRSVVFDRQPESPAISSGRRGRISGPRMIGRTLGNYTLVEKLGQGGMGEVYLADHRRAELRTSRRPPAVVRPRGDRQRPEDLG